jgi:hypothetical protein
MLSSLPQVPKTCGLPCQDALQIQCDRHHVYVSSAALSLQQEHNAELQQHATVQLAIAMPGSGQYILRGRKRECSVQMCICSLDCQIQLVLAGIKQPRSRW